MFVRRRESATTKLLEQRQPWIREESGSVAPHGEFGASIGSSELDAMLKASLAISGEIVLELLIHAFLRMTLEHGQAQRGVLILLRDGEIRIAADAIVQNGMVEVALCQAPSQDSEIPLTVVHSVIRTRRALVLDMAYTHPVFGEDPYVKRSKLKSALCMPIAKQENLSGVLYLESNLTAGAFTENRVSILGFLVSQAAISLENAYLYEDLQRSEAFLAEGQRLSHTGSWSWDLANGRLTWSDEHCRIFGATPNSSFTPTCNFFLSRIHSEDRRYVKQSLASAVRAQHRFTLHFRASLPDGSTRFLHGVGYPRKSKNGNVEEYIGTTIDLTERKLAEEALRDAHAELARSAKLAATGELLAAIVHETSQPITAIGASAGAALRWLDRATPEVDEARVMLRQIVSDSVRTRDVIRGLRALLKNVGPERAAFDINDAIREVLSFMKAQLDANGVSVGDAQIKGQRFVKGDRTQIQQIILNLVVNASEAMSDVVGRDRKLTVSTSTRENTVFVNVEDTGPGVSEAILERVFEAFTTTRASGMGMGLAISRAIAEAHQGALVALTRPGYGAIFQLTLPSISVD
ncbi:sensor histidine kinase [Paraburkholderia sp. 2C]